MGETGEIHGTGRKCCLTEFETPGSGIPAKTDPEANHFQISFRSHVIFHIFIFARLSILYQKNQLKNTYTSKKIYTAYLYVENCTGM